MEEKKYGLIKFLGVMAATMLVVFGSFGNIWRTVKLALSKVSKI